MWKREVEDEDESVDGYLLTMISCSEPKKSLATTALPWRVVLVMGITMAVLAFLPKKLRL